MNIGKKKKNFKDTVGNAPVLSAAKTILAILWQTKEASFEMLLDHPYTKLFCGDKSKMTFLSSLSRLKAASIIEKRNGVFILTREGRNAALFSFVTAEMRQFKQHQKGWDGGWRIIFFDIPEKKRQYRDYLRLVLKTVGFQELQRSIWISPYQAPTFFKTLFTDPVIKNHTRLVTAQQIGDDSELKKKFNLS